MSDTKIKLEDLKAIENDLDVRRKSSGRPADSEAGIIRDKKNEGSYAVRINPSGTVRESIADAHFIANEYGHKVIFGYNGVDVPVIKESDTKVVEDRYFEDLDRNKHPKWANSPRNQQQDVTTPTPPTPHQR